MKKLLSFRRIIEFLFPQSCIFCQIEISSKNFCDSCRENLVRIYNLEAGDIYCTFCQNIKTHTCCAKKFRIKSVFEYNHYSSLIVKGLKYNRKTEYAKIMAEEIFFSNRRDLMECEAIIPVPSTFFKRLIRRYNPSALICVHLIYILKKHGNDAKYLPFVLKRRGKLRSQVLLSREERMKNLSKVFHLVESSSDITNRRIILIDDVTTTGSTASVAGNEILKLNPSSLTVLTFAKTFLKI